MITRRNFLAGASSFAIVAALVATSQIGTSPRALAEPAINYDELMASGPLDDRSLGSSDAPVVMIEYASMTCSHCAAFEAETYPELKKRYIDTGKVRLILRDFPLDAVAAGAFALARCAPKDQYFAIIETLFAQQKDWAFVQNPRQALLTFSRQIGFSEQSFNACVGDKNTLSLMEAGLKLASQKFGVNSTPTFFIVDTKNRSFKKFQGVMSVEDVVGAIEPLLKS